MIEISIGDVIFLGGVKDALNGLFVRDGGLKGWEGSPAGRRESVARPSAHGDFDLPVFREARVVTVSGFALGRSMFDLNNLRDQVVGIGMSGEPVTITVNEHGHAVRAVARVIDVEFTGTGRVESPRGNFTVELLCADPRKFGEPHEFTGSSVQVHHYGNFPASPVVTVAGPVTGPYTISGPGGRSVTVAQSLTAGQSHRFDMATGYLYRGSVRQLGQVTHFRPWTIPPNQRVAMSINKGSMTVKVADTYM